MRYSKEESKMIWDQNAEFWDYTMGDESNDFHRNVVRPKVTELLNPNSSDYILDIACGNGNYSAYPLETLFCGHVYPHSPQNAKISGFSLL